MFKKFVHCLCLCKLNRYVDCNVKNICLQHIPPPSQKKSKWNNGQSYSNVHDHFTASLKTIKNCQWFRGSTPLGIYLLASFNVINVLLWHDIYCYNRYFNFQGGPLISETGIHLPQSYNNLNTDVANPSARYSLNQIVVTKGRFRWRQCKI